MTEQLLVYQMLRGAGRPIIIAAKSLIIKYLIYLSKKYPEATHENVNRPNSHRWIEIKDRFLEYDVNSGRRALFEAVFRIFIGEYEHDPYYTYRIEWIVEEIVELVLEGKWKPRAIGHPMDNLWKEPKPYGLNGGRLVKRYAKPYK
ncbi:hypothetical protein LCGC14_1202430 [marine sediment metagenome]|uniref:Uncharacterized protein n=1 Tax=marine sediment metagenome TaxID=412755 RepID=A0A0F9NYV4_9ZZZZ